MKSFENGPKRQDVVITWKKRGITDILAMLVKAFYLFVVLLRTLVRFAGARQLARAE